MDVLPTFDRILYCLMKSEKEKENVWNAAGKRYAFDDQIIHRWSRCFKSPNMPPTRKPVLFYKHETLFCWFWFLIFNTWDIPAVWTRPKIIREENQFNILLLFISNSLFYYNHRPKIFLFFIFIRTRWLLFLHLHIYTVCINTVQTTATGWHAVRVPTLKNRETVKFLLRVKSKFLLRVRYTTVTD